MFSYFLITEKSESVVSFLFLIFFTCFRRETCGFRKFEAVEVREDPERKLKSGHEKDAQDAISPTGTVFTGPRLKKNVTGFSFNERGGIVEDSDCSYSPATMFRIFRKQN